MTSTASHSSPNTHCPECSNKGTKVKRITLESLLTAEAVQRIGDEQYRFCDALDCETVYFSDSSTTFKKSDLTVRVGVKEHTPPRHVCYCFDHTIEEINAEVQQTGTSTVLDDIKTRMKTACWCETVSPQGTCCLATVNKYVKRAKEKYGDTERSASESSANNAETSHCCCAATHDDTSNETQATVNNKCCSTTKSTNHDGDSSQKAGLLAVGGSVLSAVAASACCWLPLILIAFGMSAGGLTAWFTQYRWLFLGLTAGLLGTSFYFVYFKKSRCAPEAACASPVGKLQRFSRIMLWVATVVVIITAAFPKYVGLLIPEDEPAMIDLPADQVTTASLGIEGMTCEGCTVLVKEALTNVPGVLDATVSYPDSNATITFDEMMPPSTEELVNALSRAGYKADMSAFPTGAP